MWFWKDGELRETGCPSCSGWSDQVSKGHRTNLHDRGEVSHEGAKH
jgi:hypothetical protein